jgi:hypothetical protein
MQQETKSVVITIEAGRTGLQPYDCAVIEESVAVFLNVLKAFDVQVRRAECDCRVEATELGITLGEGAKVRGDVVL